MPCVFSGPGLNSFPSGLEQFIGVSPDRLTGNAESLVFNVYFEDFGIYYATKNGISDGHGCEDDDGFRGGEVRIERKARAIAPGLIQSELSGEQVHVCYVRLVIGLFGLLFLVSLDDFTHTLGDCH